MKFKNFAVVFFGTTKKSKCYIWVFLVQKIWQISSVSLDTFIKHSINLIFPKSLLLHSYSYRYAFKIINIQLHVLGDVYIMYDLHGMCLIL